MPLNIWSNADFSDEAKALLRAEAGEHRVVFADENRPPNSDAAPHAAQSLPDDADVAFGQPDAGEVLKSMRLRWVHLNSAGYTSYDRDDLRAALRARGAMMTNSSNVYLEPTAEHVLAMMLALARQLPQSLDNQRSERGWHYHTTRANSRLLRGQTVLILSFGHIARRLAELLAPLRMNLIAVRRHPEGSEPVQVVTESEVEQLLPIVDHVVNILPGSPATLNYLNAARIGLIKPGAILYNIGRGTTLDQEALIESLRSGHLAAAYLDVTNPEPLPPDHPLWTTPNCYITPHSAGGHDDEMARLIHHFLENLSRFTHGQKLLNRIV